MPAPSDLLALLALTIVILGGIFAIQRTISDGWRSQLDALERQHAVLKERTHDLETKLKAMPDLRSITAGIGRVSDKAGAEHATLLANQEVLKAAAKYQQEEHAEMIDALKKIVAKLGTL